MCGSSLQVRERAATADALAQLGALRGEVAAALKAAKKEKKEARKAAAALKRATPPKCAPPRPPTAGTPPPAVTPSLRAVSSPRAGGAAYGGAQADALRKAEAEVSQLRAQLVAAERLSRERKLQLDRRAPAGPAAVASAAVLQEAERKWMALVSDVAEDLGRMTAERDALVSEIEVLRAALDDKLGTLDSMYAGGNANVAWMKKVVHSPVGGGESPRTSSSSPQGSTTGSQLKRVVSSTSILEDDGDDGDSDDGASDEVRPVRPSFQGVPRSASDAMFAQQMAQHARGQRPSWIPTRVHAAASIYATGAKSASAPANASVWKKIKHASHVHAVTQYVADEVVFKQAVALVKGADAPGTLEDQDDTIEHTGEGEVEIDAAGARGAAVTLHAELNKRRSQIHMVAAAAEAEEAPADTPSLPDDDDDDGEAGASSKKRDSGIGLVGRLHGLEIAAEAVNKQRERSGSFHIGAPSPRAGMQ